MTRSISSSPGWHATPSQGYPSITFAHTHFYIWVETATVKVKCPAYEHNPRPLARARTLTARSGCQCTNPSKHLGIECEHMCKFLKEIDVFHQLQFGFRKSHSAETAFIRLVDQLLFNLNMFFLDYKKAFNLIDHHLLLSKLKVLGVNETFLSLFCYYLSGRSHYVNYIWVQGSKCCLSTCRFQVFLGGER